MIAVPLFIVNMTFWSSFLVELFRTLVASATENMPEWYLPIRKQFGFISVIEVALTYLATAAFAASLKTAGWFRKTPSRIYIAISLLGFLLIALSTFSPDPIATIGFILSIPAVPFIMPYIMGINLMRQAGN